MAALEGALKLKEMALVHAEGSESWEMASGGATLIGPTSTVIALAPYGPGREAVLDIERHCLDWGARVVEIAPEPTIQAPIISRSPRPRTRTSRASTRCLRSRSWPRRWHGPADRPRRARLDRALPKPGPDPRDRSRRAAVTRIVLVGAGSVEFTRNLLGDILSYPELADANIVLHDIDADRLATAEQMAHWTAGALGAMPRVEAHLDRRAALTGADFVIDTIQVGGARATQLDFEIPGRYGLEYTINDTINVGGVMRGLRSIPVILGIVRDMEELCPDAWFLNYTNPMSMIIWAVTSQSEVNTVGLCHSVYWTVHRSPATSARRSPRSTTPRPASTTSRSCSGSSTVATTSTRASMPPSAKAASRRRPRPGGALPATRLLPDGVVGAPRRIQPVVHPEGPGRALPHPDRRVPDRVARNLDEFDETKRKLAAGEPFEIERSGEYAAVIIHSVVTGEPAHRRQRPEPGRADPEPRRRRLRRSPLPRRRFGAPPRPSPAAAARRLHPSRRRRPGLDGKAVLERDRDAIYHAVMQDPIVQARLTLDDTWRMTDDLIEAEAEWLPAWLGGATPARAGT